MTEPAAEEEAVQFGVGDARLYGILHSPRRADPDYPFVVMVVGGPQTRVGSHRSYVQIARGLCREGVPVLRFDYLGIGDADGDWAGFTHAELSVHAALDWVSARFPDVKRVALWALCDGSAACMVFSPGFAGRVAGMVLCNPYVHTDQSRAETIIRHYYLRRLFARQFWMKMLTFRFNPWEFLTSFAGLVRSALRAKSAGSGQAGGPAPALGEVKDFDDATLPGRVVAGIKAFGRPIAFLLSTADLTADEFQGLLGKHGDIDSLFRRRLLSKRMIKGAGHTFDRMEHKELVCRETLEALKTFR